MDKKQILVGGIMGGVLLYILPTIFAKEMMESWGIYVVAPISFLLVAGGIFYFILGDLILNKKGKKNKKGNAIDEKLKAGLITPEQAIAEHKKEMELEVQKIKMEMELEQQRYDLEKQKLELDRLRRGPKDDSKKESFKMPDVLGNISQITSPPPRQQTQQKSEPAPKKDDLDDLRNLF